MSLAKVLLLGKEYTDVLLSVPDVIIGETNLCDTKKTALGGVNNIPPALGPEVLYSIETRGKKDAFIINDTYKSQRTAFVINKEPALLTPGDIESFAAFEWAHIAYADDFEDIDKIPDLKIPYSLDFCTLNNRAPYRDIIENATLVFDSRERRDLYSSLDVSSLFVFHDEYGVEVVKNKNILFSVSMTPIRGLEVNGAGDLFAGYFIKNNFNLDIIEAATVSMEETTQHLQRTQNGASG